MTVDSGFGGEEVQDETDGFGSVTRTAEEIEQDSQAQTDEDAEASLAEGFGKAYKSPVTADDAPSGGMLDEDDGQEEIGSVAGDQTPVEEDPVTRELKRKVRRLEGQMGTFLQDRNANKGAIAETQATISELRAELQNRKAIDESIGEFVELAPVVQELEHHAQRMAALEARATGGSVDPMQIADLVDRGVMDALRPGWDQVSATKDFRDFMLQGGGPSEAEYLEYARYNTAGTPEGAAEADKFLEDWAKDMPGWWEDRGHDLFLGRPSDSIKLLDRFEDSMRAINNRRERQSDNSQRMADRLRKGSTPQGTSGDPVIGITDNEAFERGFKRQTGR